MKGFTVIEFMIICAIIGILAAVAIPAYQQFECKQRGGTNCSTPQSAAPLQSQTVCIAGYKFLSDGKTQIRNEQGGGIPCNTFN